MKILIVKLGALGDIINTFPLACHLYDKLNAEISWISEPLGFPLVSNHRAVSEVFLFDKKNKKKSYLKIIKLLKEKKFDFVFDLQRILKSAAFTIKAKSHRKITFDKKRCKELTWLLPYEKIAPKDHDSNHMLNQYLEFSDYINAGLPENIDWSIPEFNSEKIILPKKYIVLNTGATKSENKWFRRYFAKLSDFISTQTDYTPILSGGTEDINFAEYIYELCKKKPINLTGKTNLMQLSELLKKADFIVSSDTGPMHLGVAHGVKTIGLFGPSNPVRTGPFYGKIITRKDLHSIKKRKSKESMDISPERVFKNIFTQWKEKTAAYVF
ncbi:MAG: hypothetical protein CSA18_02400 [Deltaproteobacteria bacterium]|nr:MAG: hypothetical protein CSB21_01065 [Deltaproteobacteria bacterium]PIE74978.1 MAG: hypothetical protein CSA18_02400 [Deltaproteobacteria bacterium]